MPHLARCRTEQSQPLHKSLPVGSTLFSYLRSTPVAGSRGSGPPLSLPPICWAGTAEMGLAQEKGIAGWLRNGGGPISCWAVVTEQLGQTQTISPLLTSLLLPGSGHHAACPEETATNGLERCGMRAHVCACPAAVSWVCLLSSLVPCMCVCVRVCVHRLLGTEIPESLWP